MELMPYRFRPSEPSKNQRYPGTCVPLMRSNGPLLDSRLAILNGSERLKRPFPNKL